MKTSCRIAFVFLCTIALMACGTQKAAQNSKSADVNSRTSLTMNENEGKGFSSIYEYLRAKVPGLQVSGETIVIRGISSINSQGAPLILVDGVEMQDISSIRPDEVDSVEVIKDSATALYGFRGSMGVIKITTKAGKGTTVDSIQ